MATREQHATATKIRAAANRTLLIAAAELVRRDEVALARLSARTPCGPTARDDLWHAFDHGVAWNGRDHLRPGDAGFIALCERFALTADLPIASRWRMLRDLRTRDAAARTAKMVRVARPFARLAAEAA